MSTYPSHYCPVCEDELRTEEDIRVHAENCIPEVNYAWCPTHGQIIPNQMRCHCGSPAFTNGADYNAYVESH